MNDRDAGLLGGQADHAAGVPHQNRRPWPLVVRIELLEGHHRGAQGRDDIGKSAMNLAEACGQRLARTPPYHAGFAQSRAAVAGLQHGVAGDIEAGVDAQHSPWLGVCIHASSLLAEASITSPRNKCRCRPCLAVIRNVEQKATEETERRFEAASASRFPPCSPVQIQITTTAARSARSL